MSDQTEVPRSQEGRICTTDGRWFGVVSSYGFVYDPQRRLLGFVNEAGKIHNRTLSLIGYVTLGCVYEMEGTILGYVDTQGIISDPHKRSLGSVEVISSSIPWCAEVAAFFLLSQYMMENREGETL